MAPLSLLLNVDEIVVAHRDATFTSSEGIQRYPKVSNTQIAMTENLPANNTGDRNKKILREILNQAYVLLVTHICTKVYIMGVYVFWTVRSKKCLGCTFQNSKSTVQNC